MDTENDIRGVHPFPLLLVVVDNTKVYRWYAIKLDSGAVQDLGGYSSFLVDLLLMDVRVLSARSEMDSRLKPMDSRIRRRLLPIRDLRRPTTSLQELLRAKKMHAHDLNLEIAIHTSTNNP